MERGEREREKERERERLVWDFFDPIRPSSTIVLE